MNIHEMIERINYLARKKRSDGLNEEEGIEQKKLHERYIAHIKGQVKQHLDNIEIVDTLPNKKH